MKNLLFKLLAVIGTVVVLVVLAMIGIGIIWWIGKGRIPAKTVLEADFEQGMVEYVPDDPVAQVMENKKVVVLDVIKALEKASQDDKVAGLVAKIGASEMGLAKVQEVRDAVFAFRKKGKFAVAYSDTFGEFGPGNGAYYLATAFDEIYLQPSGDIGLTGLMFESPFIRGTLDKLGLTPRMDHRYEYKNAMNIFTERKYTDAHREANQKVMESMFGQIMRGIAEGRKIPEAEIRPLIDKGPFLGQEAVAAKLVDGLAYRDEVYDKVKKRAGEGSALLYLAKYLDKAGSPYKKGDVIALIYGVGEVARGKNGYDPLMESVVMGSDSVAAAFRAAIEDKNVKAILFRVDSPGGSYVASDAIWRETVRAKQAGKPVIVSMGDVAGSGGYFVAMSANKIVAQPGTITASIGVLGGKMYTPPFWDKLGISWDEVHTSANADMWTGTKDYSPEEWNRFEQWLDRVYQDFTSKVAEGRGIPKEKVLEIAKGRIWSGEDAKALNLIDELGGFPVALRLAREAAGIKADAPIELKQFPPKKTWREMIFEKEPESSEDEVAQVALKRTLECLRPLARLARQLGLTQSPGALKMPEFEPAR
jgi:protease-4